MDIFPRVLVPVSWSILDVIYHTSDMEAILHNSILGKSFSMNDI